MTSNHPNLTRVLGVAALMGSGLVTSAKNLTFDELPFQPADGVHIKGVTLRFEVGGSPSDDASYNALGPGALTHLSDPVLEGDTAGLLSLTFDHPAYRLSFGLALISFATVDLAALVSFYDGSGNLLDFGPVATEPLVDWTEGLYVGPPDNYFHSVVIEFNSAEASRFALDNLSYRLVGVPDSGTWWGGAIGAAFLGLAGMRRLTCGSR